MRTLLDTTFEEALEFESAYDYFDLENMPLPWDGVYELDQQFETPDKDRCVMPARPLDTLQHFDAHKTALRDFHYDQIDRIASKIAESFRTGKAINKVQIIGHSATWRNISKAEYARRAQERAQNVADALKSKLDALGRFPKIKITINNRADNCPLPGIDNMPHSTGRKARENRALNRRVEIRLISLPPGKKKDPTGKKGKGTKGKIILPKIPRIEPRIMREQEFTKLERAFARKAWIRAVKYVYYARWFIKYMESQNSKTRAELWNGATSFPGNYKWGVPKVWFGEYSAVRFGNVRDAVNRIWEKFHRSPWKMKRHDCIVWASAHVIVAPQIRLCDNFFGGLSNDAVTTATIILIHEMSHHIWIKSPRRQIKDRHVAPKPPCHGPCYGPGEAQMLADKFPKHAVANADNYAYFIKSYGSHLP